jgi:hypothetical protein
MDFVEIKKIVEKIKARRSLCVGKWNDNARYLGSARKFNSEINAQEGGMENNSSNGSKYPLVDYTAGNSCVRSANIIMTMLLGEGEDVITILPKEHISGSASNPYEKITEKVNNVLRFRDSQFNTAKRQYFRDLRQFGNVGIGFTFDEQDGYQFITYGVDTLGLYVVNGKIHGYSDIRSMTANEVNDFTGINVYSEEECRQDGKKTLVQLFLKNPDYKYSEKLGSGAYKWVRYWYTEDKDGLIKTDYFKTNPIKITRKNLEIGDWYGRGQAESLINTVVALNRSVLMTLIGAEKMIDPAVWMYLSGQLNKMKLDRRPGAVNKINPNDAPGGNPLGTIGDIIDPSKLLEFGIPYLQKQITDAYNIDELLDLNSNGNTMTAREVIIRRDLRAITITSEFSEIRETFEELFMDLVEDMYDRGFFDEEIKQIKGEDENKEVKFRLVFNGDFDIMQRTRKSTRTMSYLQDIAPIIQVVGKDALNANDWFKMMQDIETANGVENYLCTEEEYNKSVQGRMQGEQMMQQLEAMKIAADAQGRNGNVGVGTNLPANA